MNARLNSAPRSLLGTLLVLSVAGCGTLTLAGKGSFRSEGKLITAEQIQRSGARDAWEALKRSGTHLSMREAYAGEPTRMTYRGRSSVRLSPTPLLIVDGAQTSDFTYLKQIPAAGIASIRVLTGVSGTKYHGTGGGNGVIEIRTKTRPD